MKEARQSKCMSLEQQEALFVRLMRFKLDVMHEDLLVRIEDALLEDDHCVRDDLMLHMEPRKGDEQVVDVQQSTDVFHAGGRGRNRRVGGASDFD